MVTFHMVIYEPFNEELYSIRFVYLALSYVVVLAQSKPCFVFRWMSVVERVVKLELPSENSDVTDSSASLSSSSKPSQPNPDDDGEDGETTAPVSLPETDDICENIYESLKY